MAAGLDLFQDRLDLAGSILGGDDLLFARVKREFIEKMVSMRN